MPNLHVPGAPHVGPIVTHPLPSSALGLGRLWAALGPVTNPALLPFKNKRKPFSEPPHMPSTPISSLLAPAVATVRSGVLGNRCYGDPILNYCANVSHLSPYLVWDMDAWKMWRLKTLHDSPLFSSLLTLGQSLRAPSSQSSSPPSLLIGC